MKNETEKVYGKPFKATPKADAAYYGNLKGTKTKVAKKMSTKQITSALRRSGLEPTEKGWDSLDAREKKRNKE